MVNSGRKISPSTLKTVLLPVFFFVFVTSFILVPLRSAVAALSSVTGLYGAASSSDVGSFTTTSFNVTGNNLLMVTACVAAIGDPGALSISDTLGNLTWTRHQQATNINLGSIVGATAIWTAKVNSTSSGTITIDPAGSALRWNIHVGTLSGQDLTTPVPQSKQGSGLSRTGGSITLDTTPTSTSMVYAHICHIDNTAITPGTDFTELYDTATTAGFAEIGAETEYDLVVADGIADWSWSVGASMTFNGLTLEIAEGDTTAPTITSVSSNKSAGSYTVGEIIDIDVVFSENVTSTGNVTVTLETGATDRTCTFSVSNASTGTCDYTVQAGDTSSDLDATISGTIADQSANAMSNFTPSTGLAANEALIIDTTAPSAPGIPDMTAGTDSGSSSTDNITSDTTPDFTVSCESGATVNIEEGGSSLGSGTCSSSTVTITSSTLSSGAHSINAYQTDVATNLSSDSSALSITIDTTAPSFSSVTPTASSTINSVITSSDVGYTLSETVASGTVVATRTSGTADGNSPHTCTLAGTALNSGATTLNLSNTTNGCTSDVSNFVSGTVYTFTFDATDAAGNTATQVSRASVTFDSTAPTITSVSSDKAAGSYTVGEIIDIDVTFSEAVTSSGNVTVTLETGSTDQTCTFTVSATTTGTCDYTVQSGDTSSDLEATISGTIADGVGNAMSNFTPATGLAANEALVIDTTAPTLSNGAPSGSLSAGVTVATLSLDTDVASTCKYDTVASTAYASMTGTFDTTGGTTHSESVTGLSVGTQNYYVRCIDALSNANTSDFTISFTVVAAVAASSGNSSGSVARPQISSLVAPPSFFPPINFSSPSGVIKNIFSNGESSATSDTPLVFRGNSLVSAKRLDQFLFAPLPPRLANLVDKFPALEKTFEDTGVRNEIDVVRLVDAKIDLPNLEDFSSAENIPSDTIFVRSTNNKINLGTVLTVTGSGEVRQVLEAVDGQQVTFVVRPEGEPRSVTGRIVLYPEAVFGKANETEEAPKNNFANIGSQLLALVGVSPEPNVDLEHRLAVLDTFTYTDPDGNGIFEASVTMPLALGRYNVQTTIEEHNGEKKEIELVAVIDPRGYVYVKSGANETRITGATVSIFWQNPNTSTFTLWPAQDFFQVNPQVTDKTGKYAFLVPEGRYYLTTTASGYKPFTSAEFTVSKGQNIMENIELEKNSWFRRILKTLRLSK